MLVLKSATEVAQELAQRVRARRLRRGWTQLIDELDQIGRQEDLEGLTLAQLAPTERKRGRCQRRSTSS